MASYQFFQLIPSQLPQPQFHPILSGRVCLKNRFSFEKEALDMLKQYHSAFTENCDLLLETLEPHFQGELAPNFDVIMNAVGNANRAFNLFYKTAEIGQVSLDLINQVQETLNILIGWSDLFLVMLDSLNMPAGLAFWLFRNQVEILFFEQFYTSFLPFRDHSFYVEFPVNPMRQFARHTAFLKLMKDHRTA